MLTPELIDKFNNYFTIQYVNTDDLRRDMYRLRYEVYVDEFGYEDPSLFSKQLEIDEYDDHALACLIYHIASNEPVACIRLIPASDCSLLPIEKYILGSIYDQDMLEQLKANRGQWGEISRLAVSKKFRRRLNEFKTPAGSYTEDERTYPLLSVACFLACITLTSMVNIEYVVASMEPFLPRLIRRNGIEFKEVGKLVDYHGERKTYRVNKEEVLKTINADTSKLIRSIELELMNQMLSIY